MNLTISYKGVTQAKADVTLRSLLAFVEFLQEVAKETAPNKRLTITIKRAGEGSFIVEINVLLDVIQKIKDLFGFEFKAEHLMQIALIIIAVKLFLEGRKPKQVEQKEKDRVKIVNHSGSVIYVEKVVYNLAQNEYIDKLAGRFADACLEDEETEGVEIDTPIISQRIKRDDLLFVSQPSPLVSQELQTETFSRQVLPVLKLVFAEGRKWEFLWQGNKISATIEDKEFYENLHKYSFSIGTKIECDLEVYRVYSSKYKDFVNIDFRITKVYGVIAGL